MGALEVVGDQNGNQGHKKKKKVEAGKRSRGLAVLRDQEKKKKGDRISGGPKIKCENILSLLVVVSLSPPPS